MDKPNNIDWKKIRSVKNENIEELTYEEQQVLKEYESQQKEIDLSEIPTDIARFYTK